MELSVLCRPQTCERPEKCAVTLRIIGTPSGDISVKSVSLAERSFLDSHEHEQCRPSFRLYVCAVLDHGPVIS